MKKVEIISLRLLNFKGIRDYQIKFNGNTNIYGANASGKSTIFDAFTWLLFGKDQQDRKDHQIKTLDSNNEVLWKLDHEVEGTFSVNGSLETLKRVYKENWQKKRGQKETEFTGHDVLYYWNDVPVKAGEYSQKVNEIINESMFKLLTNTLYFNNLHWTDRRKVLLEIAGKITHIDVFDKLARDRELTPANDYGDLMKILNSGKTANEYKKQLATQRLKLKAELETLPHRIQEAQRNKPESFNWEDITQQIAAKQLEVDEIDASLTDAVHNANQADKARIERKSRLNQLEYELKVLTNQIRSEINEENQKSKSTTDQLQQSASIALLTIKGKQAQSALIKESIERYSTEIDALNKKLQELRTKWAEIDAEQIVFDASNLSCPTCQQLLPENEIEKKRQEMLSNFNTEKVRRQTDVVDRGTDIKKQIDSLKNLIDTSNNEIAVIQEQVKLNQEELDRINTRISTAKLVQSKEPTVDVDAVLNRRLELHEGALKLRSDIKALKEQIESDVPEVNNDLAVKRELKKALLIDLDTLKNKLANKAIIEKTDIRIKELEDQEQTIAQEIADIENMEFKIDRYTRAKMDIMENRINDKFKYVTFKLFERQINGGETETCECLVNGVPFSALNTASKINAGLDVIGCLSEHYQVSAPIFIDNRESITEIIATGAQIINLIVDPNYSELYVTNA